MGGTKQLNIQIRISEEQKDKFYSKCESEKEIPSEVLRKLIDRFIKDGMKVIK